MCTREFDEAFQLAVRISTMNKYDEQKEQVALSKLSGFAFDSCSCTLEEAAYVINYQCKMLNGIYNINSLEETREAYLKNVTIEADNT